MSVASLRPVLGFDIQPNTSLQVDIHVTSTSSVIGARQKSPLFIQKGSLFSRMSSTVKNPRVSIEYCTQCRWMLRSAWMAQELLTTFESSIGEVALMPGKSGVFRVMVNDVLIWDRKEMQAFPDIKHLKQLVRDIIDPNKQLGHSDRKDAKSDPEPKKNDISPSASDPQECLTCVE